MKLITYKHIVFLGLILSLSSCEDFFETTLEIDPPEHIERLVIQGFGSTEEDILNVSVSKTTGILENVNEEDLLVNDASVKLIHDGTSYDLTYVSSSLSQGNPYNYILDFGNIDLKTGETYSLEVEAEGFVKTIGVCNVPSEVLPRDFEFKADGPSTFGDEYSEVSMVLPDPEGVDNYYEFYLTIGDEFNNQLFFQRIYTESLDPVVEYAFSSLLLKDDSFDGEEKVLELLMQSFYIESEPDIEDRIYVNWRTLSEDQYLYNKSFEQHLNADGNPFASPVQVYSNIENGLGIFSIYSEKKLKIN